MVHQHPHPAATAPEHLQGSVERVTFHSPESGFCVLRVKVRGQRELVTVVGSAASITPGEYVECTGAWTNDRQHGLQFKTQHLRVVPPMTLEGIEKYLGSGMVKGIGPHFARKLVRTFGEQVFDVIEQEPERLLELEGIGPKRKERVTSAWAEQKVVREIIELQKRLNASAQPRLTRFGWTYAPVDKVIQTVNNYDKDVFNGDIGRVVRIDEEEGLVFIDYDGRRVEYETGELDEVSLAYATTVHKSQGSEYPAVVIPLGMPHYMLLERNLLYTAVTRGKQLVVVIGQAKALAMAVKRLGSVKRLTNLQARLRQAVQGDQCAEPHTRS